MKCPRCGTEIRIKVNLFLDIPYRYFLNITKQALRDADVKVEGVGWPNNMFYCPKCSWILREGVSSSSTTYRSDIGYPTKKE